MSWFLRRPRPKHEPVHLPHHRESPMARQALEESKKLASQKPKSK
jgi:hypothetical protein